ncbi:hypothetical protein M758_3G021100 [Ceratodon purpureus]|nr:hypothetical protein M758_3G021100 [Ceratodon purpureus]
MEGPQSGTRPRTPATTTTARVMVAPPGGSPPPTMLRATPGHPDGSLRRTAAGSTTAKVMEARQSGGRESSEITQRLIEHFCTAICQSASATVICSRLDIAEYSSSVLDPRSVDRS